MMLLNVVHTLSPNAPSVPTSVGVAVVFGYVLHFLKISKKVPWIDFTTTWLNVVIRAVLSGIGTLGITWSWAAATAGTGHQLMVNVPAGSAIAVGLWHWVVQYGIQHGFEGVLQVMTQLAEIARQLLGVTSGPAAMGKR